MRPTLLPLHISTPQTTELLIYKILKWPPTCDIPPPLLLPHAVGFGFAPASASAKLALVDSRFIYFIDLAEDTASISLENI
jgi:hypothetical protein